MNTQTKRKNTYYKVIQQNYGQGFEDVSFYETTSQGYPIEYTDKLINEPLKIYQSLLNFDLNEYRKLGYRTRVIRRIEKN
jgi:hypothetical protein